LGGISAMGISVDMGLIFFQKAKLIPKFQFLKGMF
jgi:hypothetical protein